MIPDPTSLETATTTELIDELGKRCFAVVIGMSMPTRDPNSSCKERIDHRGNWHAAVGLAQTVDAHYAKRVRKDA